MINRSCLWSCIVVGLLATEGCSLFVRDTSYHTEIDPSQFVAVVDNPFLPLVPGTTYRFRSTSDEGVEDIVVSVTHKTKVIAGVTTTVVHDVVSKGGEVTEDTLDWYAQDRAGNVWYFGENTREYERDKVCTEGTWETGVNGALPGIVMPAHPCGGDHHWQE